jgi:hypothetical protein
LFTGLRRDYSNNCTNVNHHSGTQVQLFTLSFNTLVHAHWVIGFSLVYGETGTKTDENLEKAGIPSRAALRSRCLSRSGTPRYLRNSPLPAMLSQIQGRSEPIAISDMLKAAIEQSSQRPLDNLVVVQPAILKREYKIQETAVDKETRVPCASR